MKKMNRREFLKYGSYGLATVVIGSSLISHSCGGSGSGGSMRTEAGLRVLSLGEGEPLLLTQQEVLAEMVDLLPVYMWAFALEGDGPRIPGVTVVVEEGRQVEIVVRNTMDEDHSLVIPGVADSGPIRPGEEARLVFAAPRAGTYFYLDALNAPVNRVMGLHGTLVVLPADGNSPYSDPTPPVRDLFNALGDDGTLPDVFPGGPWTAERTRIWVFNTIDPGKNARIMALAPGQTINPREFLAGYLPQYFTISGKTGFFSAHDPEIFPHGNVGMPLLLRVLNAGLATHSPHIHGTHVYELAVNGRITDNPVLLDTWTMRPGEVKDLLHPFVRPPDATSWPPSNIREFPMPFPMHCHAEMSQTAAGGNYPQGLVTDWEISSPRIGGPEPSQEEFPFFRGMDPALFKRS